MQDLLMDVVSHLQQLGGATRVTELCDAGYSIHLLRKMTHTGTLVRPRKGWVALAEADPMVLLAAKHNVILSCITQARRMGLWVLEVDQHHVSVRHPHSQAPALPAHAHWSTPLVPRSPACLEDPLENVLALVAYCQPRESALAIWESALNKGLISFASLQKLPLGEKAMSLLLTCTPFSDSGLESIFKSRLGWLRVPVQAQVWLLHRRVDFLIGERLVVQIDGKHHQGLQREADMRHDAQLLQEGYHVIRVNYAQVIHRWHEVQDPILGAIARGLHHG